MVVVCITLKDTKDKQIEGVDVKGIVIWGVIVVIVILKVIKIIEEIVLAKDTL